MKKTGLTILTLCLLSLGLSACSNTFEGAGKDIEKSGEWIQDRF